MLLLKLLILTIIVIKVWDYIEVHTLKFPEKGNSIFKVTIINKKLFTIVSGRYIFLSNLKEANRITDLAVQSKLNELKP